MPDPYTVEELEALADCLTVSAEDLEAGRIVSRPMLGQEVKLDSARLRVRGDVLDWCRRALNDAVIKWAVAAIFLKLPDHSKPLAKDLLAAGMRELNPSFNRQFLEPVKLRESWPRIVEWMIEIAESGGDLEIGGVSRAAYWLQPRGQAHDASSKRLDSWMLAAFCRSDDLVAQRSLMPGLHFDAESLNEEAIPLIDEALEKARNSPDEYIRHRLAVQLGTHTGPFMALDTSGNDSAESGQD